MVFSGIREALVGKANPSRDLRAEILGKSPDLTIARRQGEGASWDGRKTRRKSKKMKSDQGRQEKNDTRSGLDCDGLD